MARCKTSEIVAWQVGDEILCDACVEGNERARPLTLADFQEGETVYCDNPNCECPHIFNS